MQMPGSYNVLKDEDVGDLPLIGGSAGSHDCCPNHKLLSLAREIVLVSPTKRVAPYLDDYQSCGPVDSVEFATLLREMAP